MTNRRFVKINPALTRQSACFGRQTAIARLLISLGLLLTLGQVSMAQDAVTAPPAAAAVTIAAATVGDTAVPKPVVEGFRSARFGMDEAAIRAAIIADFGVDDASIALGDNIAERTRILSVQVPDVLEDGGTALISYVLGYKSNQLDQVSVLWSPETDSTVDGPKLVGNATVLQAYFTAAGYDTASTVVNAAVPEGIVMFRGLDAENRMVLLLLRGAVDPASISAQGTADDQASFLASGLTLAYLANPSAPDVFTLKPGQF